MRYALVLILVILGIYWLFIHTPPLPLSHESFGLYNHTVHGAIGVGFLIAAGLVVWKFKK